MKKLAYCIYKEFKVLIRDKAALAVLFLMPVILVLIVTVVQDSTFRSVNENAVPLLFADHDKDSLSMKLEKALEQSHFFKVVKKDLTEEEVKIQVGRGDYLIGIVVPAHISERLREKAGDRISALFEPEKKERDTASLKLRLFFDPVAKESFKASISGALDRIVSGIEMQSMGQVLMKQLKESFPDSKPAPLDMKPLVTTVQEYAAPDKSAQVPNAVQHNVPAWTMFAMFFICIPLSGNIIREREEGSAFRLLTMPGSYLYVILGKIALYLVVNLLQFALMLTVGLFVLPLAGLDKLQMGPHVLTMIAVALSAGLAATGFGLLLGTIANSQDQAALSGAVCVVILAALGGVWVPTFVMSGTMKAISGFSPLNWGLEAFYGVFLRGATVSGVIVQIGKLLAFCLVCVGGAWLFQSKRRMI